eukprot:gnl/TRDRNA2_/TRDRNA2_184420_c0_seq1.p1 gnl/TRDRNA2_/TRDRNA2_184420_c0~~gnl/TRDRNA2_/TRDRNA2_184420_c0_seq1.p1  ORF type:complete len:476 (+),score=68.91 gnl/TRDRNA2_/TRDRNA2_184420_c0_seq1:82-1509(+)
MIRRLLVLAAVLLSSPEGYACNAGASRREAAFHVDDENALLQTKLSAAQKELTSPKTKLSAAHEELTSPKVHLEKLNLSWPLSAPDDVYRSADQIFHVAVDSFEHLSLLDERVAEALRNPGYSIVHWRTAAFDLPLRDVSERIPYGNAFARVNESTGRYKEQDSTMFISANPGSYSNNEKWPGDASGRREMWQNLGFGTHAARCSPEEAIANANAKHLVVRLNFPDASYFGHAIDNLFPRLMTLLRGAHLANHSVSVVIPKKPHFSKNTERLLNMMGVRLLTEAPKTPNRAVDLSQVASWTNLHRQAFREELRGSILKHAKPACCSCGDNSSKKVWLSRAHETRRPIEGVRLLEEPLTEQGFEIVEKPGDEEIVGFARRLYQTCILGGFAGTAMLNMLFLPDNATVVEYNPTGLYADYWMWSHVLGLNYYKTVPPNQITSDNVGPLITFAEEASNGSLSVRKVSYAKTIIAPYHP